MVEVTLPHIAVGNSTYQFFIDPNSLPENIALYIERRRWNAKVKLNRQVIGHSDVRLFLEPNWLMPAFYLIPAASLTAHNNLVELEISGPSRTTVLEKVFIGDAKELKQRYLSKIFFKVYLQHFISMLIWAFSAISFFFVVKNA